MALSLRQMVEHPLSLWSMGRHIRAPFDSERGETNMTNFRAIYSSDLSHRARVVYMYLADRADRDGKCWPAIKTIAAELNLSRSTVKRALDDLCRAKLLTKETRWRENGGLTSNLYRIS